jgi:hypothetical protein
MRYVVVLFVAASTTREPGQAAGQPPVVTLTQVGSPIWRLEDFQLFTAPADTDAAYNATVDKLSPLHGPGGMYTPHAPPYDTELSENADAEGFVSRTVFPREAITANPNGIYLAFTVLPDPGVTASSRDFESGPVIPNSLFPFMSRVDIWLNGEFLLVLQNSAVPLRAGDLPFEGTSHRVGTHSFWNRGANPLGDYEFRSSLRDTGGHGWDIVAPFEVVAELPTLAGDFNEDGDVDAADYIVWRKGLGTTYTQAGYDIWLAHFGQTVVDRGPAGATSNSLPAVPEPSTFVLACMWTISVVAGTRRATRPCGYFRLKPVLRTRESSDDRALIRSRRLPTGGGSQLGDAGRDVRLKPVER